MIVIDASVTVDMLLGKGSEAGDALAASLGSGEAVCAPHLMDAEVGQVLRRFALSGQIARSLTPALIEDLVALPIRRYPHTALLSRAIDLLDNITVYDGLYLALAEALGCPLLTGDEALANVPGCAATVEVVATSA